MITRAVRLQVVLFVLVSALGAGYVSVRYLRLGEHLPGHSYVVHADFAKTGGIFVNAPVTYQGVPVGRVVSVTLNGTGVRVDARLDGAVRVPRDLHAVVSQRSAVGEQYLDLRPASNGGPFLADGETIPRSRTAVPLSVETLLSNLDALVESVDPDQLSVVIDELGTAFEGNETALADLLDASSALLADANRYLPETQALIRDGGTVLATQLRSADDIRRWAAALADLAHTLRSSDGDLRRLLANGPPAVAEVIALLRDLDPSIGVLLGNLITVDGVVVRRLAGLQQLLVVYPIVVAGGFTVAPGDGTAHLGLVVNVNDPPPCQYGSGGGARQCGSGGSGSGVRGTATAPRPGGTGPGPAPLGPPMATGSTAAGDAGTDSAVAGFDPATGIVTGADGQPLMFGGTGGQAGIAGAQSWKQLLLAGLAP